MKIVSTRLFRYRLPQIHTPQIREGFLISFTDEKGEKGLGDIAPLPGWSTETYDEALLQVRQLIPLLVQGLVHPDEMTTQYYFPSVVFGVQSAFTSLKKNSPLPHFPICAFLMGSVEQMKSKAKDIIAQGYRYAKIKISQLTSEEALQIVHDLKKDLRLRIDLNRAWDLQKASDFFSHFSSDEIEYVEEPVDRFEDLSSFSFPFALDETMREKTWQKCIHFSHLKAFIFKPSLQGGFKECQELVQTGKHVIFSPSFESGVGIAQIALLANRLSLLSHPLGLDTYRFLKSDLLTTPLDFSKPHLVIPQTLNIKTDELVEIPV
jgi:O-succinylbenzoate synthase